MYIDQSVPCMKRWIIFLSLSIIFSMGVAAQTDSMPAEKKHGLAFKKLFFDYAIPYTGDYLDFRQYGDGFEVGYLNRVSDQFELYVPFRAGNVTFVDSVDQNQVFGLGVQGQYFLKKNDDVFQPYVLGGINANVASESNFHLDIPLGVGMDIQLIPSTALNIQANYNYGLVVDRRSNVNITVGVKHYFIPESKVDTPVVEMPKDSDGDGITDELDLCPDEKGPEEFMGCPDKDDDGIPDVKDKCPEFKGLPEFEGCPDTDGDGISDNDDECPNQAGPKENNGCPEVDRDKDGILDVKDDCPDEAGLATTNGCPDRDRDGVADKDDRCPDVPGLPSDQGCPDSDGDGIADIDDLCPNSKGPARNKGCPEIQKEEKEVLDVAMDAVEFETGKSTLKSSSFNVLDQIVTILKKYPDYKLRISGHTDNVGSAQFNQTLSEQRARSCYEYLASRGVSTNRMSYVGFGESKPRANNNTEAGQRQNRRVEFDLYLGN